VRRAAAGALGLALAGLSLLLPAEAGAQAQPQNRERTSPQIRRPGPAGPVAPAAGVLPRSVVVSAADISALGSRLDQFAGGLTEAEREVFDGLLLRAAAAPSDSPEGTDVKVRLFTAGLRREGESEPSGIIVQGGRAPSGGAVSSSPVAALRELIGPGHVSIGPKQDDPRAPAARTGTLAIGPKQDDPRAPTSTLSEKMDAFAGGLPVTERAMLDWLLQRATTSDETPRGGTPGGPRPSPGGMLPAALGVAAIGPKQDDPSPRPSAGRWTLRF